MSGGQTEPLPANAVGWTPQRTAAFVHGHDAHRPGAARGDDAGRRFSYLPLPSLELRGPKGGPRPEHVGAMRRVIVVAPPDAAREVARVRMALSGDELTEEGTGNASAVLSLLPQDDSNLRDYVRSAAVWSIVTPVLLPGFDDPDRVRTRLKKEEFAGDAEGQKRLLAKLDDRIDGLIRKAFRQAGLPDELVEQAEIEYRKVGFRAGVDLADRYMVPEKLKKWPRHHVRVRWRDAAGGARRVRGPLAVGAGRHRGLGVFAAERG